jgi:hypothetical protein
MTYPGLTIWSDGSKLESGALGTGIVWRTTKWNEKCLVLDDFKEIFNTELFGLLEAFKIAVKERRNKDFRCLTVFSNS